MPYKDPERKKQWEREHREQRNADRRKQRLAEQPKPDFPGLAPDPVADRPAKSGWKMIFGLAVGIGVVLLAFTGVRPPDSRG